MENEPNLYLPSIEPLMKLIESGGTVVLLLLVMSVFVLALIFIKFWQFLWMGVGRGGKAEHAVRTWISGDREKALQFVSGRSNPSAKIVAHGMRGLLLSDAKIEEVKEDTQRIATQEIGKMRSYLRGIEAVVQTAPLLGLFGTVLGMIDAFQALQTAGAEADPAVLAGGIWVALLTTAVGLAVAIPAGFVAYWFEGAVDREVRHMEQALTGLFTNRITDIEFFEQAAKGNMTQIAAE